MSDFGFVGGAYEARSVTQSDQELINYYPETDPTKQPASPELPAQRGVIALYPTPGLTLQVEIPQNRCRGLYTRSDYGVLYAVYANKLYSISALFVATEIATLNSSTGYVSMSDNGTSLYICDGDDRYYYTWNTSTFNIVTDGAFDGANKVDVLDGYLFYNRPDSNQWGSTNLSTIVSGALNIGEANSSPDPIVSLIVNKRDIFLLKKNVTEIWNDAGATPFPFQRQAGTSSQHGIAAAFSVARLGESFAFLASDTLGQNTVVMMQGYSMVRISTYAVEYAISTYGDISDACAYSYRSMGHEFYVLSFPNADVTWCYDLSSGYWHKRMWRDSYNGLHRHRGNFGAYFQGLNIVGDWENGNLYSLDSDVYTDNGDAILRRRRPQHVRNDLQRIFHHSLQIQVQPGTALQTGQGSDPRFIVRWSDDGGNTFGNNHYVTIGQAGQYKHRAIIRRMGQARDRVYEVDFTDPIFAPIVSAELKTSLGAA